MAEESGLKRSRASGEVLDYLLREFEINQNPNPDQRKEISERTGMTEKAVRIWFQNRRAKLRKFERMGKPVKHASGVSPRGNGSGASSRSNLLTSLNVSALDQQAATPNELNDKYCFIDCSSLSVGTWQRIKSGQHDHQALKTSLINLSPFTLDQFMNTVDLMVILSKKNNEVNYFFAAISNNSKILFRIFYPISSIVSSSLLENQISKENSELRFQLSHTPKFSVYFFSGINANLNQWSICDDFSEAQQVSSAFYAPGGTSTPHVLVGSKSSLAFLNEFVRKQNQNQPSGYESAVHRLLDPNPAEGEETLGAPTVLHFSEEDKNNFALHPDSHDIDWHHSPREHQDYGLKGISPLGELGTRSHSPAISQHSSVNADTRFSTGLDVKGSDQLHQPGKKAEDEYNNIFTDTPDFFNAVETPGNPHIPSHHSIRDHDNLINSPSTNVHSFVSNTNNNNDNIDSELQDNVREDTALKYAAPQFSLAMDQTNHTYTSDTPQQLHHGFGVDIAGADFQAHDFLMDSPSMSHNAPTPGNVTNPAHEDQFIDYNGEAR
ncbi:hypothetical protein HF325_006423 [Metschnikowia pulcherrima]|uniref:Homeobox domain-containing protein n=1 Tax=Metschnikowia pulcherrima TaxID=27326 RepID=A0A8H7GLR6_9ASCO|nr:hypothetical protein HF325_006423 [Metschnikowia pulcherrima]